MVALVAGCCIGLGLLAWPGRADLSTRLSRLGSPVPARSGPSMPGVGARGDRRRQLRAVVVLAALAGLAVAGPLRGLLAGGGGIAAARLLSRHTPPQRAGVDAVCLAVDLLAGCLDAGIPLSGALSVGAQVGDDVVSAYFTSAAHRLNAGDSAELLYAGWEADPALCGVARVLRRTAVSGAAVAGELRRSVSRLRAAQRAATRRRAQQVGVWVVVPLGLCFLPAFVAVSVVPLVLGLAPALH